MIHLVPYIGVSAMEGEKRQEKKNRGSNSECGKRSNQRSVWEELR